MESLQNQAAGAAHQGEVVGGLGGGTYGIGGEVVYVIIYVFRISIILLFKFLDNCGLFGKVA